MHESGTLPAGWVWTTLGEVAQAQSGIGFPEAMQGLPSGDFPLVKVSDISNAVRKQDGLLTSASNYLSAEGGRLLHAKVFPKGSTLFAKIGEAVRLNRRAMAQVPVLADNNVMGLLPTSSILPKYLFHFMHTVDLYQWTQATTVPSVRKSDVEGIQLPLPPLPEQQRIVAEIEKQFTRLDAGVAALKRVQTSLKRYRAAVLKDACEGRLVEQDPADEPADRLLARILAERRAKWQAEHPGKKYVEPAAPVTDGLPELPVGWCWAAVEQIAEHRLGKMLDQVKNRGTLRPYLRNINVRWFRFDFSDIQEMRVTDEEISDISVRVGDLVICEGGEPGRAAVWTSTLESMVIQKALHRVRLAQGMSPWYLAYRLATDAMTGELESYFTGSTIRHFTGQSLGSYTFPLPPMKEQHRIVAEIERRLSVVAALEAAVTANLARAGRLRQAVLKRAFEGRLVPQDVNDVPAEA